MAGVETIGPDTGQGESQKEPTFGKGSRLLRRWPCFPLLSLGFWIAWRFAMLSGTLPAGSTAGSSVFYVAMVVVCILAAAFPGRFRTLTNGPRRAIVLGVLAALGTVVAMCCDQVTSLPEEVRVAGVTLGFVLAALGITSTALLSCELLGRLAPTEVWIWVAYTEFLTVGLYFVMAGSPELVKEIVLVSLPVLAGLCLALKDAPGSFLALAREEREHIDVEVKILSKFFVFVFLVSLAAGVARSIVLTQISPEMLLEGIAWPALERIGIAVYIIFAIVVLSKRFPFSKMCLFTVVTILVILSIFLLVSANPVIPFFVTTLAHSTLECLTIAYVACLIFKLDRNPFFIAGVALAMLYSGSFVGDCFEVTGVAGGDDRLALVVFFAIAVLCLANALVFLQEREFDALLGSVEDPLVSFYDGPAQLSFAPDAKTLALMQDTWALSPRECEVVLSLHGGETIARIAENMNLSVHTVRGYIQNIYAKCSVHSRNELLDLTKDLRKKP